MSWKSRQCDLVCLGVPWCVVTLVCSNVSVPWCTLVCSNMSVPWWPWCVVTFHGLAGVSVPLYFS